MEKRELIKLRKTLVTLGMISVAISNTGCKKSNDNIALENIKTVTIPDEYSHINEYFFSGKNQQEKYYYADNVYLFIDRNTNQPYEYIFVSRESVDTIVPEIQLYDLDTEKELVVSDLETPMINEEYFNYLIANCDKYCYADIYHLVSPDNQKEYYTKEEIKELESSIIDSTKISTSSQKKKELKKF